MKGEGNSINYKYRMHDPRIGRFFAIDPLTKEYPWNSPYAFSENVVINAVELEGLELKYVYTVMDINIGGIKMQLMNPNPQIEEDSRLLENINVYKKINFEGIVVEVTYVGEKNIPISYKPGRDADYINHFKNNIGEDLRTPSTSLESIPDYWGEGNDDPTNSSSLTKGEIKAVLTPVQILYSTAQFFMEAIQKVSLPPIPIEPDGFEMIPKTDNEEIL